MPIDLATDSDHEPGDTSDVEVVSGSVVNGTSSVSQGRLREERAAKRARLVYGVPEGRAGGTSADDVIVVDE